MPYTTNKDLPEGVSLPEHAASIYRSAFNSALEEYKDEETAAKVAWAAVKRLYEKTDEGWVRREGNRAQSMILGSLTLVEASPEDPSLSGVKFEPGEMMKFSGVLARVETNKNEDELDSEGIAELCATLPLMPIDDEHVQTKVVGVFVEAEPIDSAAKVTGVIYARRFPEEAQAVMNGQKKLSVEALAASAKCSLCEGEFTKEEQYCTCLKNRLSGSGARRRLSGIRGIGGAITRTPAGTDTTIDPDSIIMIASEQAPSFPEEGDIGEIEIAASAQEPAGEVDFEAKEGEGLQERYQRFLDEVLSIIQIYYDDFPKEVKAVLPKTTAEMVALTNKASAAAYAVSLPQEGKIIFSPDHQRDMSLFQGTLSPTELREVQAIKVLFHEALHFGPDQDANAWGTRAESIIGESLIELQATWHVANNVRCDDPSMLPTALAATLSYPNRFPWIIEMAKLVAGENTARFVHDAQEQPAQWALDQIISALEKSGVKDALTYILTPPKGGAGGNLLAWYLNLPLKEEGMSKKPSEWSLWASKPSEWSLWDQGSDTACSVCGGSGIVKPSEWSLWNQPAEQDASEDMPSEWSLWVPKGRQSEWSLWSPQKDMMMPKLQEAEAKVSELAAQVTELSSQIAASKVEASTSAERANLAEAKVKEYETEKANALIASRMSTLTEILGDEAEGHREDAASYSEKQWNLLTASVQKVKAGSLKGSLNLGGSNQGERPTSLAELVGKD